MRAKISGKPFDGAGQGKVDVLCWKLSVQRFSLVRRPHHIGNIFKLLEIWLSQPVGLWVWLQMSETLFSEKKMRDRHYSEKIFLDKGFTKSGRNCKNPFAVMYFAHLFSLKSRSLKYFSLNRYQILFVEITTERWISFDSARNNTQFFTRISQQAILPLEPSVLCQITFLRGRSTKFGNSTKNRVYETLVDNQCSNLIFQGKISMVNRCVNSTETEKVKLEKGTNSLVQFIVLISDIILLILGNMFW